MKPITHTPGPWETSVLSDGSEWGACAAGGGDMIAWVEPTADPDEEQANAHLIAAAPELLAALVEYVERHEAEHMNGATPEGLPEYDKAVAAIRKARGEPTP
jgi:hypothetical protein